MEVLEIIRDNFELECSFVSVEEELDFLKSLFRFDPNYYTQCRCILRPQ